MGVLELHVNWSFFFFPIKGTIKGKRYTVVRLSINYRPFVGQLDKFLLEASKTVNEIDSN